jgi:hypothetical protein
MVLLPLSRKSINKWLIIQWLEQTGQEDKQWATKHYVETRRMSNKNCTNNRDYLRKNTQICSSMAIQPFVTLPLHYEIKLEDTKEVIRIRRSTASWKLPKG